MLTSHRSYVSKARKPAFSLVEMMVVLVILLILGALLMPAFSRVRTYAWSTQCLSNLRQIGVGCQGYVTENDGYLPGPIYMSVTAYYVIGNPSLATAIAPYVGLTKPTSYDPIFMCPAFLEKQVHSGSLYRPAYMNNYQTKDYNGKTVYPFGSVASNPPLQPMKLLQMDSIGGLSQTWAICDLDKENGPSTAGWYVDLPESAVHGAYRNALFFDWHVGRLEVDNDP